ncbi:MAG: methylated-DNA--[protein]-cysteine S-methyltransferase [Pirellulales bacterium]|nr:methylated-DNA--[protein]-cysteine S-methyltransferase [Pirellulales bacterium]
MPTSLTEAATVVTRKTPLGWLAVVTKSDTLLALTFAHPSPQAAVRALPRTVMDKLGADEGFPERSGGVHPFGDALTITSRTTPLVRRLERFLAGSPDQLADVHIDESWCTPFQLAVIKAVRKIPLGETRTYGQIAAAAGSPRAARAVGTVMAQNRMPLVVPCHRVVASGGMGGFSARGGLRTKLRLLEVESERKSARRGGARKAQTKRPTKAK